MNGNKYNIYQQLLPTLFDLVLPYNDENPPTILTPNNFDSFLEDLRNRDHFKENQNESQRNDLTEEIRNFYRNQVTRI